MSDTRGRLRVVGGFGLLFLVTQVLDRVHRPGKHEQDADEQERWSFPFFMEEVLVKLGSKGFNRLDAQRAKGRQNAGKCTEDGHGGQGRQQHVQA